MTDLKTLNIAKSFLDLIPTFQRKILNPIESQYKVSLSPMQGIAMLIIKRKGTISRMELTEELDIPKQQMTPIIDKLIKNGFVEKKCDCNNKKFVKISITPMGLKFFEGFENDILTMLQDKIEFLTENDKQVLDKALVDLLKIINKFS